MFFYNNIGCFINFIKAAVWTVDDVAHLMGIKEKNSYLFI